MYPLIATVIGISLSSAAMLVSLNHTNPLLPAQQTAQSLIEEGFDSLSQQWDQYRAENQTFEWVCDVHTTQLGSYESCEKKLADPGFLPVQGWSASLVPRYGFMPRPPAGMEWSYGKNNDGWYFCAEGHASAPQLKGFIRAQKTFALDRFAFTSECGAPSTLEGDSVDQARVRVTFWLKRNLQSSAAFVRKQMNLIDQTAEDSTRGALGITTQYLS